MPDTVTKKVLCIAAHPDDEVLGCGGALSRHAANGDDVRVLILADGVSSRTGADDNATTTRHQAAEQAAKALGITPPTLLGLPDNRLDSLPLLEIVQQIETVIADTRPTILYTHHGGDLNIDHRIACQATLTACRPLPGTTVRAIYAFETPSSTEWSSPASGHTPFLPTHFVDVSAHWAHKMEALTAYEAELRPAPHPRSPEAIEALARWRGASGGLPLAEAFMTLRTLS